MINKSAPTMQMSEDDTCTTDGCAWAAVFLSMLIVAAGTLNGAMKRK